MKELFTDVLLAGKRNSLGRVDEVVGAVLAEPARISELYDCFFHDDAWARMRAADAYEKICRLHPDWITPNIDTMQHDLHSISQPSIQWHLAQIYRQVTLQDEQKKRALHWLTTVAGTVDVDWIVAAEAMATLVYFAQLGDVSQEEVRTILAIQTKHHSKSVVRKAQSLQEQLLAH
ncbi:MAG: hypothetical protein QG629_140 [Patescibacteria group bacterium]|nr:hypothetical protein [Candidatus Saccharibacteria bacterium]MDQ5963058.1 hypothetical protein [Patescibacteria group bacterium]